MQEKTRKHLLRRIHTHTARAMIECSDHGHGCDHRRAFNSADRLFDFIEDVIAHEGLVAHSRGYAEGRQKVRIPA